MARLTPIRLALLQDNRTQAWLAERVEVSRPEMSRIVNGLIPDDQVVESICLLLARPVHVLFPHLTGSDQRESLSTPSSEIAA